MKHWLRTSVVASITIVCVVMTVHLFDWRTVIQALSRMRLAFFLCGCIPVVIGMFVVRGIRWLTVLGLPLDRHRLWQSIGANGAASGLASVTPFQLGEIIKIGMIPDHDRSAWRMGVSAFFLERVLDLAGVIGMGLCGLLMRTDHAWLGVVASFAPVFCGQLLYSFAPMTKYLPHRLRHHTDLLHDYRCVTVASFLTLLLWLLYLTMWWIAVNAIHVSLTFGQATLLLGSVMLAVVASMTPGGLGVAELGSRGVLLWLGKSAAEADAGAIALRLLTPILACAGALCLLLTWLYRRRASLNSHPTKPRKT
ncbi:flippase-like domain-containing protein [Dyella dinghuensis]|uniref:Flippase-like domain-containing protein n=1 Tax=Dyella dinghuensis TaxID=1920169 RepID=A0A432LTY1_9GAMM|nr:lysylphosphatidylglycerol synthase transmembrane domain-containing protein [Dyella dinghuensis]RUL64278.1 flippase-like domain-containing protein [Dyella dinghuensis]